VEGVLSTVTLRFMAARCGIAVVLILTDGGVVCVKE